MTHDRRYDSAPVIALGLCLVLLVASCTSFRAERPSAETAIQEITRLRDLPQFADDMDYDGLATAIDQSLTYLSRVPDDRRFRFGSQEYSKAHMIRSLESFRDYTAMRPPRAQLNQFIRQHYQVYQSIGRPPEDDVLFTGYFEPLYPGSLTPSPHYPVPVYGLPEDLVTVDLAKFSPDWAGKRIIGRLTEHRLVPYYTREEIQRAGHRLENAPIIAWMRDPVDLYFVQVQGSGRLQTPDGQQVSILYAGQNGHSADLVGRHLIRENKVPAEEMSMQRIRRYFREHPEDRERLLFQDPSFVFFRIGTTGPLGNLGVEVTPGRSIATDRRIFPPGALAFIDTRKPLVSGKREIGQWVSLKRFVLNQDTGGAIKGPGRADLFWGSGAYAETAAGHLKHPGDLYFLILKPAAPPSTP
ncbi:MAG: MltA domain-containing protein [Desulfobacterales bacterium]|jgi:membrane-bound lytic murein transglycosylase A